MRVCRKNSRGLKRAAWHLLQNESLAIARRNLFDAESSSSNNTRANPPMPAKTLHEHSHPNPSGFQNPITLPTEQTRRIVDSRYICRKLDQFAQFRFNSLTEEEGGIELKRSHEADECKKNDQAKQVCLSGGDIYDDPSLLRFYQNDDTLPWGNNKHKEKGEDGPEWTINSRFVDQLANFMLEKKSYTKGIGEMLDEHRKELHEQFSQILSTIRKRETLKPEAPNFAITTRLGVSTQDPPFPAPSQSTSANHTKGETKKEGPKDAEPSIIQEPTPRPSIFYQPSKSSNLPFLSRLKKQKKDDEDERLLSIFKQIHINLPFLKAMIHMPKGAKVNTVSHDGKWAKKEEGGDSNKVHAVSFYPGTEPIEPLEWKAPENRLKPSSVEPPKLKLKELPEHL
ncbi:hypothetical protein Tco_0429473 [Tanacetum coccineum]